MEDGSLSLHAPFAQKAEKKTDCCKVLLILVGIITFILLVISLIYVMVRIDAVDKVRNPH